MPAADLRVKVLTGRDRSEVHAALPAFGHVAGLDTGWRSRALRGTRAGSCIWAAKGRVPVASRSRSARPSQSPANR